MYAVIRSGGKQYRVAPGEKVRVERVEGDVGGAITFDQVVAVRTDDEKTLLGKDAAKIKITGRIVGHGRRPKVRVMKYKRTNQYKITRGHRQNFTEVMVDEIKLD